MPVYEALDQLAPIQLVVPISVVHLEVVELQLLVRHLGGVHGDIQVLLHVPRYYIINIIYQQGREYDLLFFMSNILVKHVLLTMATLLLLTMAMTALLVHLPCFH